MNARALPYLLLVLSNLIVAFTLLTIVLMEVK